jgi:TRAP-type C4-dicarboxylate transport system permease small subunit
MSIIAGVLLVAMMGITFVDVVMRTFGRPVVGTYELVSLLGAAIAGLALPRASLLKAHVYVDLLIDKLPGTGQKTLRIITRILVFFMFFFAAWYFLIMAGRFIITKTVTMTLKLPFYPVVYCLAASCIAQCLVSLQEIFDDKGGKK